MIAKVEWWWGRVRGRDLPEVVTISPVMVTLLGHTIHRLHIPMEEIELIERIAVPERVLAMITEDRRHYFDNGPGNMSGELA